MPVQPKEKKLIYYITEVPSYLKTAGLRFLWTENDDTLKLSLPVASFKLPAATAPKWDVKAGEAKKLTIRGFRSMPESASLRCVPPADRAYGPSRWPSRTRVKIGGGSGLRIRD